METNLLLKSLNATFNFLKTMLLSFGQIATAPIGSNERKDTILSIPIKTGTIENRFVFAKQFKSSTTNYFSMALVLLGLFFVDTSTAQGTLGRWQMCGLSGSTGSVNPTGVDANTTFSTLTRGSGLSSSSVSDGYTSRGFSTSNLITSNNDYYEFTITPNAGYKISLSALKIRDQRSTNFSTFDVNLRFSDDGYASDVVAPWLPSTTLTNRTLDLSGVAALQNRTTAITFRIYGSDSNSTSDTYGFFCQGTNSGNFRGIDVDGTAVALPVSIGRWQMCGLSGSTGSVNPTGVDANITFSTLTRGPGLSPSSVSDGYRSSGFSTSNLITSNNDYYEFTLTPDAGYKISLSALKIRDQRSTNFSTFDVNLRFSDDGYASNVVASWLPSTTLTNRTLDLSGVAALQDRTTAITFRIYGSDSNNTSDTYGFFCQGTNPSDFKGIDFEGNVIALGSSTISVTGSTSFNYNGSNQGPTTSSVTGSTGAVTYSYSGTGATSYSASATRPTNAGTYQVIATLAADSNYNGAVSSPFAFTINKASLTITANNVNKTYGATLTGGSGSTAFTPSGLQNGQTIGTVTIAYGTGAAATAAVATYTGSVTPSAATGGTFTANNYDITYATGNIIVGKANLTITANDVNKTYGATLTGGAGSTAFTSSALQNSETIGSVTIAYGSGAASNAAVGTYSNAVTPSAATGGTFNTNNYNINYATGDIIVNPGAFVKLQLLLPGETAAPGTGSGKTGTPTSRTSGVAFNVTVNAVDAFWNVVPTAPANTIAISSSDGVAILPSNATLSSGTRNFSVTLKTVGSATVTATNVTNGLITANTSPSVTVTPGIKTTNGDGNWSDPNTWSPVGVPYFSDQVYILDADDVTVTANATCASINFTDENSSLSVNSGITLTVTGAVTLNSYNDDTDTSAEILGNGTLNAGSLNVGLASTLNNDDGSDNTLVIGIAVLNVTGDITMYNNDEGGGDANRPELWINPPCVLSASKVAMIQTGDGDGGSRIITFDVDNGATVNLSGDPNPITISSEVDLEDDHVYFDLGSSSTINYNGTVAQIIPASISNSRSGGDTDSRVPVNYGNLTINNNTGTTTTDATGRTINVAGNWTNNGVFTSTGSTVNFTGNGAQAITGTNTTTFNDVTIAKTGGTLTVNTDATVADDLTFTASSGTLSVSNSKTLNIADNLILNNNANNSVTASITGSGTLLASTVIVGPALNPNNNSTRTTTLNSSVSTFTVSNDLEINSYYNGGNKRNNGVFNLQSGVLTINGEINTTNENSGNTSTFSMASGAQSGLLKLTAASPFNLSGQGTNTINLNGTSAVVEYMGSVNQNALGTTYRTLLINNSNTGVTLSGNATAATLDLTDGLLTTGSNVMTIASGGTILNASTTTYVNGKLARVLTNTNDFTYPVGKGGVYSPVVFTYAATPGTKTVTIEQFETGSPFSSPSISTTTFGTRYWNITQSAIGTSYRVGLNDRGNTPVGSVVMLRKDNASITYNNPTTYSAPNYSNSNAFSATVVSNDVALGETAIPLYITGVTGINTKMYDGNAIATAIGTPVLAGTILSGETVTLSGTPVYTFNTKNVGTGKAVTVSGLVLTGATAGAYSLPTNQIPGLSGDITIRPLEITANTHTKVFDNTTSVATLPSITSGAIQGTDTFGFISTFDTKNAGSNKIITPSGIVNDGNGGNNYAVTFVNATGEITPRALTITGATTINKVYDGTDIAATTSGTWTLTGVISPNVVTLNKSAVFASKDAGTWAITSTSTLSGADASNYTLTQPSLTPRSITKIALTISGTVTTDKEYDRTNTAILTGGVLNGVISGEDVSLVLSGRYSSSNAGGPYVITSTSTIVGNDIANYTLTQPTLTPRSISKVSLTVIGASTADKVYNGNTIATVTGGSLVGVVPGDVVSLTQSGIFPDKNVGGPYVITPNFSIGGAPSVNYNLIQPLLADASITPKTLTISGTSQNKVYDGTTIATLNGGGLVGVVSGESVLLDLIVNYYSPLSGDPIKDAGGPYNVISTSTIASGDIGTDINNYTLQQPTLSQRNITKIPLTITGATTVDKVYDRTRNATISNGVLNGVLSGEDVTVNLSGLFSSANAGGPYDITSTSTLTGLDAGNYTLTQPLLTPRSISKITLTITGAYSTDKVYDGTTDVNVIGGVLEGIVPGDIVTLSQSGIYPTKNVGGPYDVVPNFSISGSASINYILMQADLAKASITPRPLSIVGNTQNKMYDGTDTATLIGGSLSGVVSGEDVVLNLIVKYSSKDAGGPYTITSTSTISGADYGDNYTFTQPTLTPRSITKIPLTITGVMAENKIYDGTRTATLILNNPTLNGTIVSGETLTLNSANVIGTFDTKDVGLNKTVTASNFIIEGPFIANYIVIQPNTTADITARTLTITANNISKCAGSSYIFSGTEFTRDYIVAGDVIGVTLTSLGADISATAGSYQIVASDAVGTGIENYDISYINGNLLVNSLPNATISQSTIKCLDDNASITFTGSNGAQGTSGVWYKFYYRIDDNPTELSITSVKGSSTASVSVPTSTIRSVLYTLVRVEDLNTGCSQTQTGTSNVTIGLCTSVMLNQCGSTISSLDAPLYCNGIPSATDYRFKVTKNGVDYFFDNDSRNMRAFQLTNIPGVAEHGKSYSVSVSLFIGGQWLAYGNTCTINTPPVVVVNTTQIMLNRCGTTLPTLNSTIYANAVVGTTQYRFEVTGGSFGVRTVNSPNRYFTLSQLTPGGGEFGTTYSIRVAINNGVWQNYGTACNVSTPAAPAPRMASEAINTNVFDVKAFPNPFARHFTLAIQSSSDDLVQVQIYDMIGRELEVQKATVSELSTKEIGTNYPSGVYNVVVSQGDKVKSVRMIKR